jgi:serine protease AprX
MITTRQIRVLAAAAAMLVLFSRPASAQLLQKLTTQVTSTIDTIACTPALASSKIDDGVKTWLQGGGTGDVPIIVTSGSGMLPTVQSLVARVTGSLQPIDGIDALVTRVTSSQLSALACDGGVGSISLDATVKSFAVAADGEDETSYSLRGTLGLGAASPSGRGVGVAIIDSGVAAHPDVASRLAASLDFTKGGISNVSPSDLYGHGTHVAGLIAGAGAQAGMAAFRGVAPEATLVSLKVLDANGNGRTSDVIRAVLYATAYRSLLGIDVLNLSLGHPIYEPASRDPLVRAIERASRSGLVVVVAAGNFGRNPQTGEPGYGGITSPGNAPSAVTIASFSTVDTLSRDDDRISIFSSRGPAWYDGLAKPDVAAPGQGLVSVSDSNSTLFQRYSSARVGTNYLRLSGTSMATAVASGVAALVIEAHRTNNPGAPDFAPNTVKAILEHSSLALRDAAGVEYDALTQGAGGVNAAGAVDFAGAIDSRLPLGLYWLTRIVTPVTTIAGRATLWSQRVLWGDQALFGTALEQRQIAWLPTSSWGQTLPWRGETTWGQHIVWGTSDPVWGSHIVWGDGYMGTTDGQHIVWGTTGGPDGTVWGNVAPVADGTGTPPDGV